MRRAHWYPFLLIPVCFTLASAQGNAQVDSTLKAIQAMYEQGFYLSAELEARRLLEHRAITDRQRLLAEQYIAFALVAQNKNASAAEHFLAALAIDSTFSLDPILTSPKILAVFEEAKRKFKPRRNIPSQLLTRFSDPPQRSVSFRTLLFPGWEQLYQGRQTKGYVLLTAGSLSLLSTLYLDVKRRHARDEYLAAATPIEAAERYDRYNAYYKAEYYAGATFLLVFLYSQFDAFLDLPPSTVAFSLGHEGSPQLAFKLPL
jgi:hypothetical protein